MHKITVVVEADLDAKFGRCVITGAYIFSKSVVTSALKGMVNVMDHIHRLTFALEAFY